MECHLACIFWDCLQVILVVFDKLRWVVLLFGYFNSANSERSIIVDGTETTDVSTAANSGAVYIY